MEKASYLPTRANVPCLYRRAGTSEEASERCRSYIGASGLNLAESAGRKLGRPEQSWTGVGASGGLVNKARTFAKKC